MNKKELIKAIIKRDNDTQEALETILEDMLPDFNPYKIDEERMAKLYESTYIKDWDCSTVKLMMNKYNSTLPEGLQPLPKEKELSDILWQEMNKNHKPSDIVYEKLAKFLVKTYGTPEPKPSLPSVEELRDAILYMRDHRYTLIQIAKHIIDKYGTQPREWWQDLKEGDKFMVDGKIKTFVAARTYLFQHNSHNYDVTQCTPYTAPTADEIIKKHNLTEEEVRLIREGRCT